MYNHAARWSELEAVERIYIKLKRKYGKSIRLSRVSMPIVSDSDMGYGVEGARVIGNRNAVFLNHAINIAYSEGIETIQYGAVLDDDADYVDCRIGFLNKINAIARDWGVLVEAPYMFTSKVELLKSVSDTEILDLTSSCYEPKFVEGSWIACGLCNSCQSNQV
tara:strand:- start:7793 stop:8284 length:492 start_codon:yes stop_codon:yes gene_type:complete